MRATEGFKDGVWFKQWKDQQYSTSFLVLICKPGHFEDCNKFLEKQKLEGYKTDEPYMAACLERFDADNRQNIIFMFRDDNSVGTAVHESVHAKNYVFKYHGVKLDVDNDEHEAYYLNYIFNNVLNAFGSLPPKRKNARKT